jgi:hypothetical protein
VNTAQIKAELTEQLAFLFPHGTVRVVFGWTGEMVEVGPRLVTDGPIPLDFTLTRPTREGDATFVVYVHHIGNQAVLAALPRCPVVGEWLIPDRVFLGSDWFAQAYRELPDVRANYAAYAEIAAQLRPTSIYEIGVRAGYSAYAMMANAPVKLYHAIDLDEGTEGGVVGYATHAGRMLSGEFPDAEIKVEIGDSQLLIELPRHYDLIHVDGSHSHDGALHDLELVAPWADHVLIDDVHYISTVGSAVTEFLERHNVPAQYYETWRGHVLIDTRTI